MKASACKNNLSSFTASDVSAKLLRRLKLSEFKGYDPFDGLNSPLLNFLSRDSKFLRLCVVQGFKRSPLNFRKVMRVDKTHNAKTLGLVLSGICRREKLDQFLCDRLLALIKHQKSANASGASWGYNFDWQNRVFYIPARTPTIVNTSFVGHALLDYYDQEGGEDVKDIILDIIPFFTNDLKITKTDSGSCYSYTPIDRTQVHNASLLGASLMARIGCKFNIDLDAYVEPFVKYAISEQSLDGGWVYGSDSAQEWRDSFHTGFNLSALRIINQNTNLRKLNHAVDRVIELGDNHYINDFFGDEGEPYYFDRPGQMFDIHTPAQAIYYFSRYGYNDLAEKVFNWSMHNMFNGHYFNYRKYPLFSNKIEYSRWSTAWMFYALSELSNGQ